MIVPLDADLLPPSEIPSCSPSSTRATTWSAAGERIVRTKRSRKLPSRMANWLIGKIGGVPLHDYGCSLKAYRRDVIENVRLYGEMHRFIPIYAKWQGARVTELPVLHRASTGPRTTV